MTEKEQVERDVCPECVGLGVYILDEEWCFECLVCQGLGEVEK